MTASGRTTLEPLEPVHDPNGHLRAADPLLRSSAYKDTASYYHEAPSGPNNAGGAFHDDAGTRVGLEPVYVESRHEFGGNPEELKKTHDFNLGENRVYRMYEKPVENTALQSSKWQAAKCYSDTDCITPQWMKVSCTPFYAPAKATGGYGRRIEDGAISDDAPAMFHTVQRRRAATAASDKSSDAPCDRRGMTSKDAPDWFASAHLRPAKLQMRNTRLIYNKQILFEPPSQGPPLKNMLHFPSSRVNSARSARLYGPEDS